MVEFLQIVFFLNVLLIAHTYLFYPVFIISFHSRPRHTVREFASQDALPEVAVLIAAYNEEKVIHNKIISVFGSGYPAHRLKVYVGSDASDDRTETIVLELKKQFANLELVRFNGRVGKISIINHLQSLGDEDILVMTDANVLFGSNTIFELVKPFADPRVGIVAANIIKEAASDEGISYQEKKYMGFENRIKAGESNAFGLVMGAEGGCYAIRNSVFSKVPLRFNVDDFFITLQVLVKNKLVLFNPKAVCIEDVNSDPYGEYRRKVRISSGNFQNLLFFRRLLLKFWKPIGFAFWSHKVLRWFTPFFLVLCLLSSAALCFYNQAYLPVLALQAVLLLMPLIDRLLKFRSPVFKFISHFYLMNYALLEGFVRFSRGIKSSVWEPVKRNV